MSALQNCRSWRRVRASHRPTLRVWAPTAQSVALLLFNDSNPATAPTRIPMVENAATGVWSVTGTSAWNRKFYLYEADVFVRSSGAVETNAVTDPYSLSLSTDLLTRLGVRGRTYDLYAIQPIYPQLFARLSWTMIDHDHAPPIAGALGLIAPLGGTSPAIKRTIHGVNLMLNATF